MSKTPEEMAEEYLDKNYELDPHFPADVQGDKLPDRQAARPAFLAGYKAAQQWISVKDRLPEEGVGWTMVYGCILSRWSVQPGFYDRQREEWISRFINGYEDEEGYARLESVTHWMPLPAPPKEEK
jgi:hypothetical protein